MSQGLRHDLRLIAEFVAPGARVLDVGCSDGTLLAHLARTKDVDARGIELSQGGVHESVSQGLAVVQGDADTDLPLYPDDSFDYVILSQTVQAMRHPRRVLEEMLRISRFGIVSFTNYAHWQARLDLLLRGRMPVTPAAPEPWWRTANIHPCTLADFEQLCAEIGAEIEERLSLGKSGAVNRLASLPGLRNLLSEQALFLLSRGGASPGVAARRHARPAPRQPASAGRERRPASAASSPRPAAPHRSPSPPA
jgi:methionine biosynthesis protein MetW